MYQENRVDFLHSALCTSFNFTSNSSHLFYFTLADAAVKIKVDEIILILLEVDNCGVVPFFAFFNVCLF